MKAIVFNEHGGPEKLILAEFPDPIAEAGEVVISVKACGLNHVDLWVLQGNPNYPVSKPHALGSDVSGVVESVGSGVNSLNVGDRVIVTPGIPCFLCENCIQGQDDRCSNFVIFGTKQWGGYAEKVKVSSRYVLKIPDTLSFEESAAFPLSYLTAWHMLITRAALQKGERVLVI